MDCTLKVNMILGDGKHYSRGSVVDKKLLPPHLQLPEYIVQGVVHINRVMPIDVIEIEDLKTDDDEDREASSPMHELTMEDLQQHVVAPPSKKKLIKRR